MNWGECDLSPIKKLRDKFQNVIQTKMIDSFIKELLEDLANLVIGKTKRRTPSNTGNLRRNWKMGKVIKSGEGFYIEIFNDTDYASFVESGFRSHFVPGHWEGNVFVYSPNEKGSGMYVGPKGGWVEGKFMLKISMKEVENLMPAILDKKSYELFMKILGSDN